MHLHKEVGILQEFHRLASDDIQAVHHAVLPRSDFSDICSQAWNKAFLGDAALVYGIKRLRRSRFSFRQKLWMS